jgi:hypothetical protein
LYFIVEPEWGWLEYWAQYYPSGFKNIKPSQNVWVDGVAQVPNHRWGIFGQEKINYDFLEGEDGMIEGWDDDSEFYLFTPPPPLENKPFLNWKQSPWEVKE